MIAAGIFLLLFCVLLSMYFKRPRLTVFFFFASLISIMLLFWHHATDALNISL